MNRILLDTNIILDIALKREPFFTDSAQIFNMIDGRGNFGNIDNRYLLYCQ